MRFAWLWVLLSACYAPRVTAGAPCDPQINNCPRELACTAGASGYTCERPGGGGDPDAAAVDTPDDPDADGAAGPDARIDAASMIDAAPDAPAVTHVEYPATVADCVNRNLPNPDTCANVNGSQQLVLDANDSTTGNPWDGYIRFDLDGVIAGRTLTSVKLRMTATDANKAPGPDSGVVWSVQPFTHQTLFGTAPAKIGAQPISPSQGAVDKLDVLDFPLPPNVVTASQPLYLGMTTSAGDGVNYWNKTGANPPRLIIDMAP